MTCFSLSALSSLFHCSSIWKQASLPSLMGACINKMQYNTRHGSRITCIIENLSCHEPPFRFPLSLTFPRLFPFFHPYPSRRALLLVSLVRTRRAWLSRARIGYGLVRLCWVELGLVWFRSMALALSWATASAFAVTACPSVQWKTRSAHLTRWLLPGYALWSAGCWCSAGSSCMCHILQKLQLPLHIPGL